MRIRTISLKSDCFLPGIAFFIVLLILIKPVACKGQLAVTACNDTSVCQGTSGILKATVSGGTAPFTFLWYPSVNIANPTSQNTTINNVSIPIKCYIKVKDAANDSVIDSVMINTIANPVQPVISPGNVPAFCEGLFTVLSTTPVSGNSYVWLNNGVPLGAGSAIQAYTSGLYSVKTTNLTNQCFSYSSNSVNISILPAPDPHLSDLNSSEGNFICCGCGDFTLQVEDNSIANSSSIINYYLDWGDQSTVINQPTFPVPCQHLYNAGDVHTIKYLITNSNNCKDSITYKTYNITNPHIGITNNTITTWCDSAYLCFPISSYMDNPTVTIYKVDYGDGDTAVFPHPPPDPLCHQYNKVSCGNDPASFTIRITAINSCQPSVEGSVGGIVIARKPKPDFLVSTSYGCVGQPVQFTNTTLPGFNLSCNGFNTYKWDFGDNTTQYFYNKEFPSQANATHTYSVPGTYTITLTASKLPQCGSDSIKKTICIQPVPDASFTYSLSNSCVPIIITPQNTSNTLSNCGNPTYVWSVDTSNSCTPEAAHYEILPNPNVAQPTIRILSAGNYKIKLTVSNLCGSDTYYSATILAKDKPNAVYNIPSSICENQSITPVPNYYSCNSVITSYQWSFPGGSTPPTPTAPNPGTVTYSTAGTYNIRLRFENLCGMDSLIKSLIVYPKPTVIFSRNPDTSVCTGNAIPVLNLSSNIPAASFSWSAVNSGGITGYPASGSTNIIPGFTPVNSNSTPGTITFSVTPTSPAPASCVGNTVTFVVTVKPRPNTQIGTLPTPCVTDLPFTLTSGTPAGGTWSGTGITNGIAGIFSPSVAGTGAFTLTYTYQDPITLCSKSATKNITVSPAVSVSAGSNQACCIGQIITLNGGSPAGGTWSGPGVNGNTFNSNLTGTGSFTITYQYGGSTSCNGSADKTITVNALPVVEAGDSLKLCLNAGIVTLTGQTPAGGTWTGTGIITGTQKFNPLLSGPGTFSLTYTYKDANTCTANDVRIVTVFPLPPVEAGDSLVVCASTPPFNLTGFSPGGGTWSGTGISNPSVGTFNPAIAGVGVKYMKYSITESLHNCTNTDSIKIRVVALPVVSAGPKDSTCIGQIHALTGGTPAGGTWTGPGVTGSNFNPALTGTGTFTLTYHYTAGTVGAAGSCTDSAYKQFKVNPLPIVEAAGPDSVCLNNGILTLTGQSPVGGTWSGPGVMTETQKFNPAIAGPGTYNLTYTYNDAHNCSASDTRQITVFPLPSVEAGDSLVVCTSNPPFNLTGNSPGGGTWSGTGITDPAAGTFNPTMAGVGVKYLKYSITESLHHCTNTDSIKIRVVALPVVSAGPKDSTCIGQIHALTGGTPAGGTWTGPGVTGTNFNPALTGTGTFTLTYHYTAGTVGAAGSCTDSAHKQFKVNPLPIVEAAGPDSICLNNGILTLTGQSPVGGTWSGPGVMTGTQKFNPVIAGPGTYSLTYTYKDAHNCSASNTRQITVFPLPSVEAGDSLVVCVSNPPFNLTGNSPGGGTWSGTGISNPAAGTFNPAMAGVGVKYMKYSITESLHHCTNTDSIKIRVVALPVVSAGMKDSTCIGQTHVLTGGTPAGGTWSGPGVTGNNFNPALTGTGTFTLTYHYTAGTVGAPGSCTDSAYKQFKVNPLPIVEAAGPDSICLNSGILTLTGQSPAGGTWSGPGVSGATFNPMLTGIGAFTLTYTYKDVHNCTNADTRSVVVKNIPGINIVNPTDFCIDDPSITLNALPSGGTWSGPGVSAAGIFQPSLAGVGIKVLTYTYFDPGQDCANSATISMTVHPLPVPQFSIVDSLWCINWAAVQFNNLSIGANFYHWNFGDGQTSQAMNPSHQYMNTGNFLVTLLDSSVYGCTASITKNVRIISPPNASFTPSTHSGCAPVSVNLTNYSSGYDTTNAWYYNPSAVPFSHSINEFITLQQGINDTIYFIRLSVTNLCGVSTYIDSITVYPSPVAKFGISINHPCSPATAFITNHSTGIPDSLVFHFADTIPDILLTPPFAGFQHLFFTDSLITQYNIRLIAYNHCGTDTCFDTITVLPNTVKASFLPSSFFGCAPLSVSFPNFSTGNNHSDWYFGDGGVSQAMDTAFHTYLSSGVFQVELAVNNGCSYDTSSNTITVYAQPVFDFTFNDSVCSGDEVTFHVINSTGLTEYSWDFGNGTVSQSTEPVITFPVAGQYQITLIASADVSGCKDTVSKTLFVKPNPVAEFLPVDTEGCHPFLVNFTNQSTFSPEHPVYYLWDFDDNNNTSVIPNPGYTFHNPDPCIDSTFHVKLTVFNWGCEDFKYHNLTVHPKPISDFSTKDSANCLFLPSTLVTFINQAVCANQYLWDFGDQSSSAMFQPEHEYLGAGNYQVELIVTNVYNCSDSSSKSITVFDDPNNHIVIQPVTGCEPLETSVNLDLPGTSVFWDFGNGQTSAHQSENIIYNFGTNGIYTITSIIEGAGGCKDTITFHDMINVFQRPVAQFDEVKPTVPPSGTVNFLNYSQFATHYHWNFGDGSGTDEANPVHFYNSYNPSYLVELFAFNEHCEDSVTKIINFDYEGLFIPNAFAPMEDDEGIRYFRPVGVGLRTFHIEVYDTWGNLIWQSSALNNGRPTEYWDGKFNGTLLPADTYVWKASATYVSNNKSWEGMDTGDGKKHTYGTITLIK